MNKTENNTNTRKLNKEELEQVTGGVHQPSYYVGPNICSGIGTVGKAPNETNQMPRGMQESAVVEQYSPLP